MSDKTKLTLAQKSKQASSLSIRKIKAVKPKVTASKNKKQLTLLAQQTTPLYATLPIFFVDYLAYLRPRLPLLIQNIPVTDLAFNTFIEFRKKSKLRLKTPFMLCVTLILLYVLNPTAFCAAFEVHNTPIVHLQNLLDHLDIEELEQFHNQYDSNNNLLRNLALAVIINLAVISLVWYGPSIYDATRDFIIDTAKGTWHLVTQSARDMALNRARELAANANEETQQRMIETALRLIAAHAEETPPAA